MRVDGRLAAMAGERMKLTGFTEVSGVCVHPDFRGAGYARELSRLVAGRILARGETPFLHAFDNNTAAITLYESLGFQAADNGAADRAREGIAGRWPVHIAQVPREARWSGRERGARRSARATRRAPPQLLQALAGRCVQDVITGRGDIVCVDLFDKG